MMDRPVKNISASVRQRLLNLRRDKREDYNALLTTQGMAFRTESACREPVALWPSSNMGVSPMHSMFRRLTDILWSHGRDGRVTGHNATGAHVGHPVAWPGWKR